MQTETMAMGDRLDAMARGASARPLRYNEKYILPLMAGR